MPRPSKKSTRAKAQRLNGSQYFTTAEHSACLTNAYSKGLDPVQTAFAIKQFKSHRKVGTPAEIKQLLLERELLLAEKAARR